MKTTAEQMYRQGYALPQYGLFKYAWRYYDQIIELPFSALEPKEVDGWPCARWHDVQKAAI